MLIRIQLFFNWTIFVSEIRQLIVKYLLLTCREHLGSPSDFVGIRVAHIFSFLFCGMFCLSLSCVLCA